MKRLLSTIILMLGMAVLTTSMAATKALFLTGGQSNTDGRLYANTLPSYLQSANQNALVSYHAPYSEGRLGVFYPYFPTSETTGQPGRWAYDAVTYYYIGQALQESFYVAKTSYGGTSIDPGVDNSPSGHDNAWLSGYGAGYHWSADPTFLAATAIAGTTFVKDDVTYDGQSILLSWIANIDAAIDAIIANGDTPDIKAIIWHQGESDKNAAGSYYNNLKAMVAYLRQHLVTKTGESKYATMPFFCGTIPHASSLCNSTVEKAFFTLEDEDPNFHVIDLRDLAMLSDAKHFDAPSAELFGKRLYNRMIDEGVISGTRLDDVEYAQVDYSDFGTDKFFGETKTVTFEQITSDLKMTTYCHDNLYLHSNNMNSRAFVSASTSVGSVTFADGTEQTVTRTLTPKTGANGWTVDNIAKETNASSNKQVAVAANVLYPGRFSMMISAPDATAESPITMQLIFNGSIVAEKAFTSGSEIYELRYDAPQAGTFFMHPGGRCTLYAVRYKTTTDRTWQRQVTTDADGYATFGNITGANLGLPTGLTAWAVAPSAESNTMVEMTQLLGVDKNTGVILQGEPSTTYTLPFAWTAQNYEGENAMTAQQTTGNVEETSGEDFINYTFANKKFTKVTTPVSVAAGKAYLSISNGYAHTANNELTFDEPEADAATDCGRDFLQEKVVYDATTWNMEDCTLGNVQGVFEKEGMYYRSQPGSEGRSFYSTSNSMTVTFADGTTLTPNKKAGLNNGPNGATTITESSTAVNENFCDYFAINALYPGKFSVLVSTNTAKSAETRGAIYVNGVPTNFTDNGTDVVEWSVTTTEPATILFHPAYPIYIYALRFVPTEDKTSLRQATMSSAGYAVFTNLALAPLTLPEGLSAYALQAGDVDDDATKKVSATVIGKGEAVLLKGDANETYTMTIDNTQTSDVATENYLQPVLAWQKPLANDTETGNAQYIFAGDKFTKADGTTKVYKGEAILSVPAGDAMAAYSIVKLTPAAVTYDFVDVYTLFGNDEAVTQETTWLTGDMTTPGSDGTVQQLNGLYGRGQSGSNNRSFFKNSASGSATFSDGTPVSWSSYLYINADYNGGWSLSASTTANNTTCGDYLAFNAAVPGTVYVLFSSKDASQERTLDLYYKGSKAASATSTGNTDIKEIKYNVTTAGTLLLDCRKTCRVYALRFVPDEAGIYTRVTPIGWGSMSLPYPAVVPEGTCVYYVSDYTDGTETGTLTMTKVDAGDIIPAKAGFLFNGVKGLYRFAKSMTAASWTDNMLVGTADGPLTDYDKDNATDPIYVLAQFSDNAVGFKKFSGTSIAQYKAYLQLGTTPTAREFRFAIDGDTGIGASLINGEELIINSSYDLQGRKLSSMRRGLNIVKYTDGTVRKVMKR